MASPHHSPRLSARSWLRGNSRTWTDGSTHAAGRGLVCYATVPSCTPPCRTCLFQDLESTTLPYGFRPQVTVPTMMKQSLWEASQGPGNPPSHDWPRLQDSGPVHSQWVCTKQADGSWLSWISPPVFQNPPKGSEGQQGNREGRWHARVLRCWDPGSGLQGCTPTLGSICSASGPGCNALAGIRNEKEGTPEAHEASWSTVNHVLTKAQRSLPGLQPQQHLHILAKPSRSSKKIQQTC